MARTSRRAVLGALAGLAGLVGLAGCGYRHGGGEFRWRTSVFYGLDGMVVCGDTLLLVTRRATTFDFDSEQWTDGGYVTTLGPERGEETGEYGFEAPTSAAALGDESVYVGRADGAVTAVRIWRGREPDAPGASDADTPTPDPGGWTTPTDVAPSGVDTLAVGRGGTVYAGGSGGVAALARDGSVRWRWREGPVEAVVRGGRGTAVLALAPDRLVALAADGSVRWTREAEPTDREPGARRPLVDSEGVYLADGDGVTALAYDGSVRWERDVSAPVGRPALTADGVYHASTDGVVRSFSLDGRERWAHEPRGSLRSEVAAADGRAFVLAGESLVGIGDGGIEWRAPLDEPEPFTPEFGPFAVGETLVVGGPGEVRGYWRSQRRE
jgi:hypothetical protein